MQKFCLKGESPTLSKLELLKFFIYSPETIFFGFSILICVQISDQQKYAFCGKLVLICHSLLYAGTNVFNQRSLTTARFL